MPSPKPVDNISLTAHSRSLPLREPPSNNLDIWMGRFPQIPNLRIYWHTATRVTLLAHCFETPDVEVGGVLLGGIYRSPHLGPGDLPMDFVEIQASIRAGHTNRTSGQMEFTNETWMEINDYRDHNHPDKQIVGWYHTHPGHGLLLSGKDQEIQNNFFREGLRLALLIETHEKRGIFFVDSATQQGPFKGEVFCWDTDPNWLPIARQIFRQSDSRSIYSPSTRGGDNPAQIRIEPDVHISRVRVHDEDDDVPNISISEEELGQPARTGDTGYRDGRIHIRGGRDDGGEIVRTGTETPARNWSRRDQIQNAWSQDSTPAREPWSGPEIFLIIVLIVVVVAIMLAVILAIALYRGATFSWLPRL